MPFREPTAQEARLLRFLGEEVGSALANDWMDGLLVEEMRDGGMGSLTLSPRRPLPEASVFGKTLSACRFADKDGVPVVATLYATRNGTPFELDVWKVDFSPVTEISLELEILPEDGG